MPDAVAVLMSVFTGDDAESFERALRSVLNQDVGSGCEVRVYLGVDGEVSPALAACIRQVEPLVYRCVWFRDNRGLVYVLNDLIALLEDEEYVFRMDSDDLSLPHRFSRQISFMESNTDVDILGTSIIEVDEMGERRTVHFAGSPRAARRAIARRVPVAHPTVCYRRGVLRELETYPLAPVNEDVAMWFRCMRLGYRFSNVMEPLYEFTVGPRFWGRRGGKKAWGEFQAYAKGIWTLDGVTWRYIFPCLRLLLRYLPRPLLKWAYSSSLRLGDGGA